MGNKFSIILLLVLAITIGFFHAKMKKEIDTKDVDSILSYIQKSGKWEHKIAPHFESTLLNEEKFDIADHVGKEVIILNFFATWCAPCIAEMAELNRFYQDYEDQGVILLGIDAKEEQQVVEDFIAKHNLNFPITIDGGTITDLYGVTGYPVTVLIGADGTIHLYETGSIANSDVTFKALVRSNLKLIEKGKGISKKDYLEKYSKETYTDQNESDDIVLTGRSQTIVKNMPCPCGCTMIVSNCTCQTADKIKKDLQDNPPGEKETDKDVMVRLDKKYCVGVTGDDQSK